MPVTTVVGPEALNVRNPLLFPDKSSFLFDGYGGYQQYRENSLLLNEMTTVSSKRRAPTLIGHLVGQAQITAKSLTLAEIATEKGVARLFAELDKKFRSAEVTLSHDNVFSFFDFVWDPELSVDDFVDNFHAKSD